MTLMLDDIFRAFSHTQSGLIAEVVTGRIRFCSDPAEKLFGYWPGALVGANVESLMPKRFWEVHVKHRQDYSENPTPRNMGQVGPLRGLRKDGKEIDLLITLKPVTLDSVLCCTVMFMELPEWLAELIRQHKPEILGP